MNPPRFYEDHFAFVWSCLRRMGVPPSDLEDAAHDVFVAAHRHRGEIAATSARSWLFGAVRRIAANHRRRAWRHQRRVSAAQDVLPTTTSIDRDLARSDASQIVARFLDGLGDAHREAFMLFELQEFTAREVAQILGININTASARLRVARSAFEQFAARLREENAFDGDAALAQCRVHDRPQPAAQARVGAALAVVLHGKGATGGLAAWMTAAALGAAVSATTVGAIAAASPTIDDRSRLAVVRDGAGEATAAGETQGQSIAQGPATGAPSVAQLPVIDRLPVSVAIPPRPSARSTAARPAPAPTHLDDALAVHNDWLERARDASSRGDHREAVRLGAAYRERFPAGVFVAELGLLEVRARCADGDDAGARRVGEQLVRVVGGAAHGALLDRTCAATSVSRSTKTTSTGN